MKKLLSFSEFLLLMMFYNVIPFLTLIHASFAVRIITVIVMFILYIWIISASGMEYGASKKLRKISKGCRLVKYAGFAAVAELVILPFYIAGCSPGTLNLVFSIVVPVVLIAVTLFCGIVRIALNSRQIKITDHFLLLMLWWMPVVNIFLFRKFYKTARRELIFESDRLELENTRAQNEVCKTKYPVLMVHGIFFRDWQLVNYWGRIPPALIRNGAQIYYGNQQSSASVERSAGELRERILEVIRETGAEKINIIAHSKGGLDSRYAISCLGMDKYVATLTTVSTPHLGCAIVDFMLEKLPKCVIEFVTNKYNSIYTKLGDRSPDFMAGVTDLTVAKAQNYNEIMPDSPDVSYRSYMTLMSSFASAGFPLNIGYLMLKKFTGHNDGLVGEESSKHGDHTLIPLKKGRGVSHADTIDLMRENIDGFDVREFYVEILRRLAAEGY